MQSLDNNTQAFLALVRAGLWEKEIQLRPFGNVDYDDIMRLAEEQSVVGLVAAGLEHVAEKIPKETALQFVGYALQIEQRNADMNRFIGVLVEKLRRDDIYTLIVKGQGIAQCYERPLWRTSGDIDFLLSYSNYEKAKEVLLPLATAVEKEDKNSNHLGFTIGPWPVELHGSLRSNCLRRMDIITDSVQDDVFYGGNVRSWMNGETVVFLPSPNNDVFFIFSHILKHFFHGGIGLRQICDWCRLLWVYRDSINTKLLEERIINAGIMTEWKAFAALVVEYLGMPVEAMPFYSNKTKWSKTADRIIDYVIDMGNFGHNMNGRHPSNSSSLVTRKLQAFGRYSRDGFKLFKMFPLDSIKVWLWVLKAGISTI